MPQQTTAPKVQPRSGTVASRLGTVALAFVIARLVPGGSVPGAQTRPDASGARRPAARTAAAGSGQPSGTAGSDGGSGGGKTRGREAESPADIPAKGWLDILWRVYEEVNNDRIQAVAAGVTFYILLALFPAIAAFISLYGLFADPSTITEQLNALSSFMPGGAIQIVSDQVHRLASHKGGALGFAFFSGLAISLWSANAGMKAVFDALNVAYDESEKRNFIWLNLWSLGFTLGALIFLMVAFGAVVVVPVVLNFVGLGSMTEWLIRLGRWPALLVVILAGIAVLYRYGPSRDRPQWRWLTPGSLLAGIGWIVFSILFSWYVSNFGNYNETYGSLGAAIGFMTWVWLSTTIILVGAELNAETEHQTRKDSTEGPQKPLGQRGAEVADSVGHARAS